jgi:uncharacterized protein YutE (UPF0331/DUF86 family)
MNQDLAKNRILEKSLDLERFAKELSGVLPKTAEDYKKSSILIKSTVERRLQLISDTEIDILAILYKNLKLKVVGEDMSLITAFSDVLNGKTIEKIRRLRDLRNKLTHEYKSEQFDEEVFKIAGENTNQSSLISNIKHTLDNG